MVKKEKTVESGVVPHEAIEGKILLIRGKKVMLDRDLAELYGVTTGRLNEQVKRNIKRFPEDFMFQLTKDELDNLISQFATSSWGGIRKLPYVFTEQGVAMLSSVLNSERAIQVNIAIMRVFVKLKEMLSAHKELLRKFEELERRVGKHDEQIYTIFEAIRQLMEPPPKKARRITGFKSGEVTALLYPTAVCWFLLNGLGCFVASLLAKTFGQASIFAGQEGFQQKQPRRTCRPKAGQSKKDCFVASLLAMT